MADHARGQSGGRAHAERLGLEALVPAELRGRAPAPLELDMSASRRREDLLGGDTKTIVTAA